MRQKDETKAQDILRATLDEIQAVGLAGLSIDAVARRAGVATGTVYIYFKGKEALIEALYVQVKKAFSDFVLRDEPGEPLRAAFFRIARAYLDYSLQNKAEIIFMGQVVNSPYSTDRTREVSALGEQSIRAMLERGKAEQVLKDIDVAWMMAFLSETLKSMAQVAAKAPKDQYPAFQDTVATLCWDALKA